MISHSHKVVAAATILLTVGLGSMHPVSSQPAPQDSPTEASQDRPTPVATIDPKLPVKVILINQSKLTLEYGRTDAKSGIMRIAPGETQKRNVSSIPFYGVIYPITSSSNRNQEPAFKFDVTSKENVITVKIWQLQDGAEGDSVIRIRPDGSIFVR